MGGGKGGDYSPQTIKIKAEFQFNVTKVRKNSQNDTDFIFNIFT